MLSFRLFLALTIVGSSTFAFAKEFPDYGLLPKQETEALSFLKDHPEYDGRGVVVAVFDTGVDPGTSGLSVTSDGKPKILDIVDGSGSGDVDTSTVVELDEKNQTKGLTGRTLTIPNNWKNPSGKFHLGMKPAYELYPVSLVKRLKQDRKKRWDENSRKLQAKLVRELKTLEEKFSKPNEKQKQQIDEAHHRLTQYQAALAAYQDPGPIFDCVVFHDGEHWRASVDVNQDGDFSDEKVMTNFREEREYGTFDEESLVNYVLNIYDEGNLLSIVVDCGTHATHVAGIIAANYPDQPELNGVAPGAQIVSVKIGDTRIGSSSLGTGELRGLITVLENKCDLINMSYGGPSPNPNAGRFANFYSQIVNKHGVIFVSSAGNDGPALSTVGSPGGTTSAILGVGAYVSPELMEVGYSLREKLDELPFTWSSRGPAIDGDLGVDICAPGGAIAPVSAWALSKNQLMNGTSMSSPNACGGLALLLSGLKSEKIKYSPAVVKRAVKNTARPLKNSDPFSTGRGLLQINQAWQWLEKHANAYDSRVRFEVRLPRRDNARGIYLRESFENNSVLDTEVFVDPIFHEETENRVKNEFEMKLQLKCDANWVVAPENFFLHHKGRDFWVKVDPTSLKPGEHFTEIFGFDAARPELGPVFRLPITVIKAEPLKGPSWEKSFKFTPGKIHRSYLDIPQKATWADLKIKSKNYDANRLFVVHTMQLVDQQEHSKAEKRTYVRMEPNQEKMLSFPVQGGKTLELCVAQFWESLGETEVEFELQLHGIHGHPQPLILDASQSVARLDLMGTLRSEDVSPSISLDVWRRNFRPTSSTIKPLSKTRDQLPDNQQIYGLTLEYQVTLTEKATCKISSSKTANPNAWDWLSSSLWMIYDKNKRLVAQGIPGREATLEKGTYTIRQFFRHEDLKTLESLTNASLWVDQKMKSKISLSPYESFFDALGQKSKVDSKRLLVGETLAVHFRIPKLPAALKSAPAGDKLLGNIYYGKSLVGLEGAGKNPAGSPVIMPLIAPPESKPTNQVVNKPKEKTLEEHLFETKLAHLKKLAKEQDAEKFEPLFKELLKTKSGHLLVLQTKLEMLDNDDRKQQLPQVVKACDRIIKTIKVKPLVQYFGLRRDPQTEQEKQLDQEMQKQKEALIDALYRKARAVAYMDLPVDPTVENPPTIPKHPKTVEARDQLFEKTYQQLNNWVDPTEKKYALVHLRRLRRHNKQGEALSELNQLIKTEATNLLYYKKRADIYGELGWLHLEHYENQWRILRQRKDYLPF